MATLSITRNYADGEVLLEADLDEICDDLESFLNTEQLGDANIADAGITASDKLIDSSISAAKLATDSVITAKIQDSAVTTAKIAANAVTDAKIQSGGLAAASLATNSVTSDKIAANNVTAGKLANGAVDVAARLADSVVTTAKINDGAVTQAKRSSLPYATATTTSVTSSDTATCTVTLSGRPVLITIQGTAMFTLIDIGASFRLYKAGSLLTEIDGATGGATGLTPFIYLDTAGTSGSVSYTLRNEGGGTATITNGDLRMTVIEL
jgi:hypothetical protein